MHAETPATAPAATYEQQIQQWRSGRLQRLTAPDGWLSLIGLEWLQEGDNRVGSAADADGAAEVGQPPHALAEQAADELDDLVEALELPQRDQRALIGGVLPGPGADVAQDDPGTRGSGLVRAVRGLRHV